LLQFTGVAATVAVIVTLAVTLGVFASGADTEGTPGPPKAESTQPLPAPLVPGTPSSGDAEGASASDAEVPPEGMPYVALSRVFADVSARVQRAVVNISTSRCGHPRRPRSSSSSGSSASASPSSAGAAWARA
jgi:hypothetical protein